MNILNLNSNIFIPLIFIFSLFVWRISYGLVYERGFLAIFYRLKQVLGVEYDDEWNIVSYPVFEYTDSRIKKIKYEFLDMLSCVYCTSLFISVVFSFLIYIDLYIAILIAIPFSLSAIAILYHEAINWLQ